jgi:hypothetical protein
VMLFWVMARLFLVLPVAIAEARGVAAIGRAFAMTRGLALRIAGVVLLYMVVLVVVLTATQSVFGLVFHLLLEGDGPLSLPTILTSVVVGAVTTALEVLANAYCGKLYVTVRASREAVVPAAL